MPRILSASLVIPALLGLSACVTEDAAPRTTQVIVQPAPQPAPQQTTQPAPAAQLPPLTAQAASSAAAPALLRAAWPQTRR